LSLGSHSLLGFAFASADLLIEIAADGKIAVALGASAALSGSAETALVGRAWRDFIDARDRPMVEALFDGLGEGVRGGPVVVSLTGAADGVERAAALSALCLPGNNGAISCTFSRAAPKSNHGLHDKIAFEVLTASLFDTARTTGLDLELALVEMGGLGALRKLLAPEAADDLEQRLTGLLRAQSHGGNAAAELGNDRYALVRPRGEPTEALLARLMGLIPLDAAAGISPSASAMPLAAEATSSQVLRAIRYSLDTFLRDGMPGAPPATLSEAISQSVRRTLMDVGALGQAVNERRFRLVYQPVVDLKSDGDLHHHEVLVRFGDNGSPFPMIRMAEELDLIEPLDLAVVEQTIGKLVADKSLRLAVNISGRTIGSPGFVQAVRTMLAAKPQAKNRLIFELTESSAIDDLPQADRHLQALRAEGCLVCLDDFGAGAASLAYLQQLTLDVVKIDGRYIRELQHGGRESTFIRHLVHMCAELGVKTLAEMVETPAAEEAVRLAGVDYAQGWLYGAPADAPDLPLAKQKPAAVKPRRRVGAVETWG
jgi:EAL domain-containing protein (putative c-di-GMP-specific phosphodiesterase class I)